MVREVAPEIILTHGPYDYMEDHTNTGRLAVSAAFCRGMKNFKCTPTEIVTNDVCVYHSMPHSITDGLRRPLTPEIYVDITSVIDTKVKGLCCHVSQKNWLDLSQGKDAYIDDLLGKANYWGKRSMPGSSVHGIPQAKIVEWVTMPTSRGSSPPRRRRLKGSPLFRPEGRYGP